jgi:hypothetical protein
MDSVSIAVGLRPLDGAAQRRIFWSRWLSRTRWGRLNFRLDGIFAGPLDEKIFKKLEHVIAVG